ncbi:hypothetical protein EDD15DRAFT_2197182 [Pisolithus albus]|nr:hypothetical protein EDD15DRAFT_2197182 [Pisolithus albus]
MSITLLVCKLAVQAEECSSSSHFGKTVLGVDTKCHRFEGGEVMLGDVGVVTGESAHRVDISSSHGRREEGKAFAKLGKACHVKYLQSCHHHQCSPGDQLGIDITHKSHKPSTDFELSWLPRSHVTTMPKAKSKLQQSQKILFCPDCGKRFENKTGTETHSIAKPQQESKEDMVDDAPGSDGFGHGANEDTSNHMISNRLDSSDDHPNMPSVYSARVIDDHPSTPSVYPGGTTFMDQFFNDQYATLQQKNLYYPFASQPDWQLASWLLHSCLSMAAINDFLSLQLVKELPISFRSAKELRLCTEMLPSGPAGNHILSVLSHPLFASHMSFIPQRVWSSSAWVVRIYEDWMSGDHAWNLQTCRHVIPEYHMPADDYRHLN